MFEQIKRKIILLKGNSDLGFVGGLFLAIFLLVVPVHKDLLSLLLVIDMAYFSMILLTIIYLKDPSEFSVFPLLLAVTLYRLGLNVASTRLILLDGDAVDHRSVWQFCSSRKLYRGYGYIFRFRYH